MEISIQILYIYIWLRHRSHQDDTWTIRILAYVLTAISNRISAFVKHLPHHKSNTKNAHQFHQHMYTYSHAFSMRQCAAALGCNLRATGVVGHPNR